MSSSSSSTPSPSETLTLIPLSSSSSQSLLIPGLPNDISSLILCSLPLPLHPRLRSVSRLWRSFLSPSSLLPLRRLLRRSSHLLLLFPSDPSLSSPLLLDPLTCSPLFLPPLPVSPYLYALSNFLPSFIFPHLFLLGGSLLDARSYPLNHPLSSRSAFRLDLSSPVSGWSRLPNMLVPRGSFACAALPHANSILVAGGGSRHPMFPSGGGARTATVERLDVASGEWTAVGDGMPAGRAGCTGFVRRGEFWVMGGYAGYRTVAGVVPEDVFCKDAVAMDLETGRWREVGDMWEDGERRKLGKVGVVEGMGGEGDPGVFMLDNNDMYRYDFALNRWLKESSLPRKLPSEESCCFVAMNGELYVMTSSYSPRPPKKRPALEIQVYNPIKGKWRLRTTNLPFNHLIDFKAAVSCTVKL
ncbi:kelch motif family protein [Iris pallida]|uniref:Kelch motif family protein n=1 Tax=Iris pallida TaxID=29817 RepID=A0AAX6F381_IRIPA|nr:kelch motif family protein [Iris pallida]